jgi:hypothetical protein
VSSLITYLTEIPKHRAKRRSRSICRRQSLRRGRAIHLLDIENLVRSARPTTRDVTEVMAAYQAVVPIGPADQFVVAANPAALLTAGIALPGIALPGAQLLARSGPDGADRALTETAYHDRIDLRFERAVIGSGDGYFVSLATWLAEAGLHVTVVSRPGCLNWRLYTAVPDTVAIRPVSLAA